GLYRIHDSTISYGDVVAFPIPDKFIRLVKERRWIPEYFTLLKPVAAIAGDAVCFRGGSVFVSGVSYGDVRKHDSQGKPMPSLDGCHRVEYGDIWVLIKDKPLSLDSRYFGPISRHKIYGKATLL
ncbi:MAG: S26 family signal peptidase, partial [Ketobacter sp.]|nr:S26 family signal peptidase [Ketobacter sp.]